MNNYKTIRIENKDSVATVSLNRPDIHNAFNNIMIAEITSAFSELNHDESVKAVILKGEGKSFCAGADLNWMRDVSKYSFEENFQEGMAISNCMYAIYTCKKPTIARIHGAAIGGATGLLAACDFALAEENTVFSLSEVKIGIIPACIGPYIVKRVGEFQAKELMLTGMRIKGPEAEKKGLINRSLPMDQLDAEIQQRIDLLKSSGPKAIEHCKKLLYNLTNTYTLEEAKEATAKMIAEVRASQEGQEGMAAFLEKRKPSWVKPTN